MAKKSTHLMMIFIHTVRRATAQQKNIIARAIDGECEESVCTRLSHIFFFVSRARLRQPNSS